MSRQGMLFKQIKETELTELPIQFFLDYADNKRGIETFVKIIERENRRLPFDFDETSGALWNGKFDYDTTSLELLMMVIGRMETPRSYEVLINFATGDYHPYVCCEAVFGLTFTSGYQREFRNVAIQKLRSPRHVLDLYSGIMIFSHCFYRFKSGPVIELLKPFLDHPVCSIRMYSAYAIAKWEAGKTLLREYRKTLTLDGTNEQDKFLAQRIEEMTAPNWPFVGELKVD